MPTSRLRQLLKFIRVFGITDGIRLWFSLLFQTGPSIQLQLPHLPSPIQLRRHDLPIFWQIMIMKENDFHSLPQASRVSDTYKKILSEGNRPIIVDCGGHIGLSAVWFASRFPEATLYCIEPDKSNFNLLQQNTAAYPNVICLNGGVWNKPCHLEIQNPLSGSASFQLRELSISDSAERPNVLRAYTIPEVLQLEEKNRLFLVKMDIEGAEAQVFQEPTPWLAQTAVMIIELHDWLMPGQGTSRNVFKRLGENNLDVILQGENLLLFQIPDAQVPNANKTASEPLHDHVLAAKL
ncbi:FkbM family methyltransferase [Tunturiibacter lichenicola]|uniref:FkbM family methyltransferase n=1 Tax=Tunturiibacter lichenicola TaxID=2051959 RepID=UPI003D9AF2F4